MPTYLYKCKSCDNRVEKTKTFGQKLIEPHCESCKKPMQRDYSFGSVAFRGSGFYSTDK